MRPFLYQRAGGLAEAVQMTANRGGPVPPTMATFAVSGRRYDPP